MSDNEEGKQTEKQNHDDDIQLPTKEENQLGAEDKAPVPEDDPSHLEDKTQAVEDDTSGDNSTETQTSPQEGKTKVDELVENDINGAIKEIPDDDINECDDSGVGETAIYPITDESNGNVVEMKDVDKALMEDTHEKVEDEEEESPKVEIRRVGVFEVFRYANSFDIFLLVIGTTAAILHGLAFPSILFFFGEIIDSFVDFGSVQNSDETNATVMEKEIDEAKVKFADEVLDFVVYYCIIGVVVLFVGFFQVSKYL
ncbi:ATP-dependent translocase ABCB1-like [Anneissia japonica]|uniref:ATP-dependent translocase ABCB1-like n=1 Tax=Anneissia japonica TaxID=1529436 RepID=UPI0014255033|nr:ATP-dependent translocase ABCB1-like [Anneissia japonica]